MLTILSLLCSYLYYKLDITDKKILAIPSALFIVLYALSFDLQAWDKLVDITFLFNRPRFGVESYILFFMTLFSFAVAIASVNSIKVANKKANTLYSIYKLRKLYYYFSILSIIAFSINMIRVYREGGINLMFIDPRAYESLFGESFLINYVYFLNVPALCLFVFLNNSGQKMKGAVVLNTLLVVVSFFHGIKFTVFDTILYPTCFYYMLKNKISLKPLIYVSLFLLLVFSVFSAFVRGGDDKSPLLSIVSYILPNFYNLAYSIEIEPIQFGHLAPLFLPDKFYNPAMEVSIGNPISGFVLNDSYNMYTSLHVLYAALNFLGPLIFVVLYIIQYVAYVRRNSSIFYLFFSSYLFLCMIFSFYFYAYTKFKNVYYVFLFLLIHCYCKRGTVVNSERNQLNLK